MIHKLVIFDCDGVLVDTEQVANEVAAGVLSAHGPKITGNECRRLFQGKTLEAMCGEYTGMNGLPADTRLPRVMRQAIEERMTRGIEAIDGAVALVTALIDKKVPLCVASSGSIAKMHKTLAQVGLLSRLESVLFSAQDVGRGKPHPDVFLAAARAMGVDCHDAVIIEDSLSGVIAGKAAGARVLGYAGDPFTDGSALNNAGAEVFHHMDEVPQLIGFA